MRRVAPAVALFFVAPLVAEFLLGNLPVTLLPALIVLAPMYGGGALLIREVVRRRGRGWPSILALGFAYAVLEEAFTTQTLFNPNYLKLNLHLLDPRTFPRSASAPRGPCSCSRCTWRGASRSRSRSWRRSCRIGRRPHGSGGSASPSWRCCLPSAWRSTTAITLHGDAFMASASPVRVSGAGGDRVHGGGPARALAGDRAASGDARRLPGSSVPRRSLRARSSCSCRCRGAGLPWPAISRSRAPRSPRSGTGRGGRPGARCRCSRPPEGRRSRTDGTRSRNGRSCRRRPSVDFAGNAFFLGALIALLLAMGAAGSGEPSGRRRRVTGCKAATKSDAKTGGLSNAQRPKPRAWLKPDLPQPVRQLSIPQQHPRRVVSELPEHRAGEPFLADVGALERERLRVLVR